MFVIINKLLIISMKNSIQFPLFIEIALRQKNSFWVDVFTNLAHGRAPHGCYITSSSFLVSTSGKGESFSYFFLDQSKDVSTIGREIIDMLSKKLNFMSMSDRALKLIEFERIKHRLRLDLKQATWAGLRKKKIKDQLIETYVLDLKRAQNLPMQKARDLLSVITMNLIFKQIDSDDITIKNARITDIKCSEKTTLRTNTVKPGKKAEPKKLSDIWTKYAVS